MQYFPTDHISEVDNYPYGRLRATAFFGAEFNKKFGFRTTFQTINPKNNRLNAVKKSTYYPCMLKYIDPETGHYKYKVMNPSEDQGLVKTIDFLIENFELFTPDELQCIASNMSAVYAGGMQARITYRGADKEKVLEIGLSAYKALCKVVETPTIESLQAVYIDYAGLDALEVEGYNPFTVKSYGVIGS